VQLRSLQESAAQKEQQPKEAETECGLRFSQSRAAPLLLEAESEVECAGRKNRNARHVSSACRRQW